MSRLGLISAALSALREKRVCSSEECGLIFRTVTGIKPKSRPGREEIMQLASC